MFMKLKFLSYPNADEIMKVNLPSKLSHQHQILAPHYSAKQQDQGLKTKLNTTLLSHAYDKHNICSTKCSKRYVNKDLNSMDHLIPEKFFILKSRKHVQF